MRSACFTGPSKVNGPVAPPAGLGDGPPASVFRSLDLLQSLDSTAGDDPAVFQSTVALEYFPSNPMPANGQAAAAAGGSDPFTSREWASDYKNSHVEVPYSDAFDPKAAQGENGSSLPPKKRGGTHWDSLFKQALAPLVDAASAAQRETPQQVPGLDALKEGASAGSAKKRANRRKPRKIIPEKKDYVEFTEKVG